MNYASLRVGTRVQAKVSNWSVAIVAVLSALILSPLGANRILVVGGNFVPEVIIIPLVIYIFGTTRQGLKRVAYAAATNQLTLIWLAICMFCLILGLLNHGLIVEAYASFRGFMFLVIGFALWQAIDKTDNILFGKAVQLVKVAAMSALASSIVYYGMTQGSVKQPYPMVCFIIIALCVKNKVTPFFLLAFCAAALFCGVASAYRLFIVYAFLIIMGIWVHFAGPPIFFRKGRGFVNTRYFTAVAMVVLTTSILAVPVFEMARQWIEADQARYHQVIYKFQQQYDEFTTGSFDAESDQRIAFYDFFGSHMSDFVLPSGFYDRKRTEMFSIWGTERLSVEGGSPINDGGFLFMIMSFGLVITIITVIRYMALLIRSKIRSGFNSNMGDLFFAIVILASFVSMGNVILVIGQSFFIGIALAMITSRRLAKPHG